MKKVLLARGNDSASPAPYALSPTMGLCENLALGRQGLASVFCWVAKWDSLHGCNVSMDASPSKNFTLNHNGLFFYLCGAFIANAWQYILTNNCAVIRLRFEA